MTQCITKCHAWILTKYKENINSQMPEYNK